MRRVVRPVSYLLVLALLVVLPLSYFYTHYQRFYDKLWMEDKIDYRLANGIKHAYAASEVFVFLRSVGFSDQAAEGMVSRLGKVNERMEQNLDHFNSRDSTAEIMRDLYNNQVGITGAQWHLAHEGTDLREVILWLGQHGALIPNEESPLLAAAKDAKKEFDVAFAYAWYDCVRASAAEKARALLATRKVTR